MTTIIILVLVIALIVFIVIRWKSNVAFEKEWTTKLSDTINKNHENFLLIHEKYSSKDPVIHREGVVELLSYLREKELDLQKYGTLNSYSVENPEEELINIRNIISDLEKENDLFNQLDEVKSSPEFNAKWELINEKLDSDDEEVIMEGVRELKELAKEVLELEKKGINSGASKAVLKILSENFPDFV